MSVILGKLQNNSSEIENLLVTDLTVGGDVLDRVVFYRMTQGMDEEQLKALRGRVEARVEAFYQRVHEDEAKRMDNGFDFVHGDLEKERKYIEKGLNSWFRPWTRLAGRIEDAIDWNRVERGVQVDERLLSTLLVSFSHLDEYKPYLEREFKGFVSNRCLEYGLDYMKMPQQLRNSELEKKWREEHPYLLESMEWDVLGMAYKMGSKREMVLKEEESFENGYIGGKVTWSRFLELPNGPVLLGGRAAGKVTGVGQIDYKDCTNCFVIMNGNERAVNFYGLSREQRCSVMERIFMLNSLSERQAEKNINRKQKGKSLKM